MIDPAIRICLKGLLALRYRTTVHGLDEVAARGTRGILFLPNHPALIDPFLVGAHLQRLFRPRFLADESQVNRFFISWLARRSGVIPLPDLGRLGAAGRQGTLDALERCAEALRAGENLVLYPAGRLQRGVREDLGSRSGAFKLLAAVPGLRVVLVRSAGLRGSVFGWVRGRPPHLPGALATALGCLALSALFFAPRRKVAITLEEPGDLPRDLSPRALNERLEEFYNRESGPALRIPYAHWPGSRPEALPEDPPQGLEGPVRVSQAVRESVIAKLEEISGRPAARDEELLGRDLGLDSLALAEFQAWIAGEFGRSGGDVESLSSVGDALLAAQGEGIAASADPVPAPPRRWFSAAGDAPLTLPPGRTLTELFLASARARPSLAVLADRSGLRSYRKILTSVYALLPALAARPGHALGLMLPAVPAAAVAYLATLFAGKLPVLINWTVGPRHLPHCLELSGAREGLTSRALVARLRGQGVDLSGVEGSFLYLEDLAQRISRPARLAALLRATFAPGGLSRRPVPETAAVLFTSGSESRPKAVPLTHAGILANFRDMLSVVPLLRNDRMLGMLPPFHSFGLTVGMLLPLSIGLPLAMHPSPTEAVTLARLIDAFRLTLAIGTPTFLGGIARATRGGRLESLRLIVTGAEKCPGRTYEALSRCAPQAVVLEGYGITECSPVVAVNRIDAPVRGSIGRILPSLSFAIVDPESGRPVAPGATGLLLVRGPSVFHGYLGSEAPDPFVSHAQTRWYRTGDLVCDQDGVLFFKGRLKRFVKIGGEMISLPGIEEVLNERFPAPDEAGPVLAVASGPEEVNPELILFTTLALERERVNASLRAAGLSGLHHIRRVVRLDALPLLGTGKVDYRGLDPSL